MWTTDSGRAIRSIKGYLSSLGRCVRVFLALIPWFDFDVPICGWWIIVWFADNLWESSAFWWHSMQIRIFGFLKSRQYPLHVCIPFPWVNSSISCVWRRHFWLEQSVNSKASPWLSFWLDELSLEKLLEILIYGLIVLKSTVITSSISCSSALGLKFNHIVHSDNLIAYVMSLPLRKANVRCFV